MEGYGELKEQGKEYYGYFLNGKRDGFGIAFVKDSDTYCIGFWRQGKQTGVGKILNKKVKYALFSNGKALKQFRDEEEAFSQLKTEQLRYSKMLKMEISDVLRLINS